MKREMRKERNVSLGHCPRQFQDPCRTPVPLFELNLGTFLCSSCRRTMYEAARDEIFCVQLRRVQKSARLIRLIRGLLWGLEHPLRVIALEYLVVSSSHEQDRK